MFYQGMRTLHVLWRGNANVDASAADKTKPLRL